MLARGSTIDSAIDSEPAGGFPARSDFFKNIPAWLPIVLQIRAVTAFFRPQPPT
jgi:hypothetical protein